MTTTTLKLDRGPDPKEAFCYGPPTHPPTTPGEWFARRYPAIVQQWGAPMLEMIVSDPQGNRLVKPLTLNEDFFAAVVSDPQFGHSVVFFEPEQQWFFYDPADNRYHPVNEDKLLVLLSALITRCAEEMPRDVDVLRLFRDLRSEEVLRPIVKRARAIHAADATFFDEHSSHQRVEGIECHAQLARRFVRATVKVEKDRLLPINECYQRFSDFCRNQSAEPVHRHQFKKLIAEVIREEFGLGMRADVKNAEGRFQRGWKGLALAAVEQN